MRSGTFDKKAEQSLDDRREPQYNIMPNCYPELSMAVHDRIHTFYEGISNNGLFIALIGSKVCFFGFDDVSFFYFYSLLLDMNLGLLALSFVGWR